MGNLVTNVVSNRVMIEQQINQIIFINKSEAAFELIKSKNVCKFKYEDGTHLIEKVINNFKKTIKSKIEYPNKYSDMYFYRKLIFEMLTGEYYQKSTKIDKTIQELQEFKRNLFDRKEFGCLMTLINELQLFQKKYVTSADKKNLQRGFGINVGFSSKIEKESELTYEKTIEDYRSKKIITIDSHFKTAYDDAISIEKIPDGYLLGIYITDVASYIGIDTRLFDHISQRGASIYTSVDNNSYIPMLPLDLTRNFFSLNKNCNKHVIAHFFRFSDDFDLIGHYFSRGLINIDENYTFDNIEKIKSDDTNYDMIYMLTKMTEKLKVLFNFEYHTLKEKTSKKKHTDNIGDNIITTSTVFLNAYMAELFNKLQYPFIYRINNSDLKTGLNEGSKYSEKPLGHIITNGKQYGHVSNPIRNFACFLNQYFETELLLDNEEKKEAIIDYWSEELPEIVEKLNLRLNLNNEYRNALEKICNKQLTKRK